MDTTGHWARKIDAWTAAGVIDADTARRIRAYESGHAGSARMRWPVMVALVFGALMLGAGVLLFVSSHWDRLSPTFRFTLVAAALGGFHVAAALTSERFRGMATTLHAIGTVALGGAIYISGQIFNLAEHWPGGIMLWALGAAVAWAALKDWPQFGLAAILIPAWLSSEWILATERDLFAAGERVLECGLFLLALAYFIAPTREDIAPNRRVLLWAGGVGLPFTAILLTDWGSVNWHPLPRSLWLLGWTTVIVLPLSVAVVLRKTESWPMLIAAAWVLVLLNLPSWPRDVAPYAWWAIGAVGLAAWGVVDAAGERINMGAAFFAATVLAFYFSEVMDKLERSASLVGLGALFLIGGWMLERVRRRLLVQARGAPP